MTAERKDARAAAYVPRVLSDNMSAVRVGWVGRLRKHLLGIGLEETSFARRGFQGGNAGARQRLEQIGRTFLEGYHAALENDEPETLALPLNAVAAEFRGFAFEGAAMGLALLDRLAPWKRDRWLSFIKGPAAPHIYMAHVGVGWVLARLRRPVQPTRMCLDPLLGWLVVDGYGFHEGYFHWPRYVERQVVPRGLTGYALRVFDQGLGRSMWFVNGADVLRIPKAIAAFAASRRADLWSGVGLACAYAGSVNGEGLETLRAAASSYNAELAQGAAFAAKARQRAENPADHTELTCQMLCGVSADTAAKVTDLALDNLPFHLPEPAYEVWRSRIQSEFGNSTRTRFSIERSSE